VITVWVGERAETWYAFGDWCAICASELTRGHPEVRDTFACITCLRIDAALARAHGATLMTPLDDVWGRGDAVLLHRRGGDASARKRLEDHRANQLLRRVREARDHWKPRGVVPAVRWPGGSAWFIDRDPWQELYPPGPTASAEAYTRYAAELHPWIADVDPRAMDASELASLLRR